MEKDRKTSGAAFVGGVNLNNPEEVSNVLGHLQSNIQGLQQTCSVLASQLSQNATLGVPSVNRTSSRLTPDPSRPSLIGRPLSGTKAQTLASLGEKSQAPEAQGFSALDPEETEAAAPAVSPKKKTKRVTKKSIVTSPVATEP